jgi:hypothetical protein
MRSWKLSLLLLLAMSWCGVSAGQSTQALGQTFHAPKADIEQALKDLNAYRSGKLPFLEGFVGNTEQPLSKYERAYYQYTITVTQKSDSEVEVAVNAKISAWLEDKDPAKSAYLDLPSNGRLEADLLERLRGRLRKNMAEANASREPLVSRRLLGIPDPSPADEPPPTPDAPSTATPAVPNFKSVAPDISSSSMEKSSDATDARHQRLLNEERILNGVLAAQDHPTDLVAVKHPHTRVTSAPSETARTVMFAEAEDEFQFLKFEGDWVHVQISGLNRGWIRRSDIEIAGDAPAKAAPAAASPESFQSTKEETGTFPGEWATLRGKNVKIIWVQITGKSTQKSRLNYAESMFKKQTPELAADKSVDGVVIVFDAAEGGMAAAPVAALRQWGSGTLTDAAFLKQCWFDPPEAFTGAANP